MAKGRIVVNENLCKGCELCTSVCPQEVIKMAADRFTTQGYHPAELVDPDEQCTGCAICSIVCPDVAITVFRWVPADKIKPTVP